MSIVSEAQEFYFDYANLPFYGIVYVQSRRVGKDRLTKESQKVISKIKSEMWDEKMTKESSYASSELERFKQDKLTSLINRMTS